MYQILVWKWCREIITPQNDSVFAILTDLEVRVNITKNLNRNKKQWYFLEKVP